MSNEYDQTMEDTGLERGMAALRAARAPERLVPSVLAQVGLADRAFSLLTPIGDVFVAYNDRGISAVRGANDAASFARDFRADFGRPVHLASQPPAALLRAVDRLLRGQRADVTFDLRGLSEFEQAVLRKAREIPRGEVRPYAWVAREIGHPGAARAVGSALARNPAPLLIPCHRVVRADGEIGEYALGSDSKRVMLESEGARSAQLDAWARRGVRYLGSETTKIYCFPTCRHARRIGERHRHLFRSEHEAATAGFRPCQVCRPTVSARGA